MSLTVLRVSRQKAIGVAQAMGTTNPLMLWEKASKGLRMEVVKVRVPFAGTVVRLDILHAIALSLPKLVKDLVVDRPKVAEKVAKVVSLVAKVSGQEAKVRVPMPWTGRNLNQLLLLASFKGTVMVAEVGGIPGGIVKRQILMLRPFLFVMLSHSLRPRHSLSQLLLRVHP